MITFKRSLEIMQLAPKYLQGFRALLLLLQIQIGKDKYNNWFNVGNSNLYHLALCIGTSTTGLRFSNVTSPITTVPSASTTAACCFVVQDTVSEAYWERLQTRTTYYVINVTSIVGIALFTPV